MQKFVLNKNDSGQRLDKFLQKALKGIPLSLMYKYIRKKRVKVNGKRAKENQMLECGDVIELYIPDEFSKNEADTSEYDKVKASPVVIYEDDNVLICDKRAGMLSHTGDRGENGAAGCLPFCVLWYVYRYSRRERFGKIHPAFSACRYTAKRWRTFSL